MLRSRGFATVSLFLALSGVAFAQSNVPTTRAASLLERLYDHQSNQVLVAAHRGDWHNAPENSLQAIENCIAMGVDIIEIDVRLSRDAQLVVIHDKTLERTTTGVGKVGQYTLQELKSFQLKDNQGNITEHRLASLEEVLDAVRGKVLVYVDKSEGMIAGVYEVAKRTVTTDQVLFYGSRTADQLQQKLGPLAKRIHYLPKLADGTPSPVEYVAGFQDSLKPPAFIVSFESEDSAVLPLLSAVRQGGARVWASPLWPELCAGRTDDLAMEDPAAAWGWLIDQGATILCTDRPAALLNYLRGRGLHE